MQPYKLDYPQEALDDLRERLANIRWPQGLPEDGWARGVPQDYLRELVEYWRDHYDWRKAEAELNQYPQFTTTIDGARVYFIHVRSPEPTAVPLLITHGWPGSVAEFLEVIGPLTDPRSHGGDPAEAFHLVIPSIPGFGFSGPAGEGGWNIGRVASAWAELMKRLGYHRYIAQAADFGIGINLALAMMDSEHMMGLHLNGVPTTPLTDDPAEIADFDADERSRLDRTERFVRELSGSMKILSTRPHTVAYGFSDSPVALLAYIVEKFKDWTDTDLLPEDAVDRDRILTVVMSYWLPNTGGTSSQFYYEIAPYLPVNVTTGHYDPISVPFGVAVFPHAPFAPVRRFIERDFPTLVHWSEFDRGGNFAALEEPDLYLQDVRAFRRTLERSAA
ncbi:MAG TPA: epoxide hydrolase [Jatrophihabitans sp.]|nr:epoxide hydrolase [Jatrophihabitans sp.]